MGGATRTPLVHRLLNDQLKQPIHCEINPDLCVAMGAAIQGGLIAGVNVGPVLVDITPHTLGIEAAGQLRGGILAPLFFAHHRTKLTASGRSLRDVRNHVRWAGGGGDHYLPG